MVPSRHANDGGGSIRIPASECGLVGLKPRAGRVVPGPEYGDLMGGLVAERVRDPLGARHRRRARRRRTAPCPATPTPRRRRRGPSSRRSARKPGACASACSPPPRGGTVEIHPDCVAAVEAAGALLESLGHAVEDSAPADLDEPEYIAQFIALWASGQAWNFEHWERVTGVPSRRRMSSR